MSEVARVRGLGRQEGRELECGPVTLQVGGEVDGHVLTEVGGGGADTQLTSENHIVGLDGDGGEGRGVQHPDIRYEIWDVRYEM